MNAKAPVTRTAGEDGADSTPSTGRILAVIGGVVLVLTVAFSVAIVQHHGTYRDYRSETLDDANASVPWDTQEVSVEGCVAYTIDWTMACPGIAPWCQAEVPVVMETCLASTDRAAYCAEVGDEILSTRFGYEACQEARTERFGAHEGCQDEAIRSDRYACRAFKKYCAGSYRAIAKHCLALRVE